MTVLILGLIIFLGVHATRIVANDWRSRFIAQRGEGSWKGIYTLASLLGFGLIVWGYSLARQQPVVLWVPPRGMNHVAGLLMGVSFVMLVATYVPRNAIKARLHHPMVLATKVWALAHLLANGNLADVALFGSFLVWAVFSFRAARQRDRAAQTVYATGTAQGTAITVVAGLLAWAGFTFWAHRVLIGVQPLGMGL
jgi:uncharacterized membrane protein